jgi:thioredoxin-like negative regulator of GroEL
MASTDLQERLRRGGFNTARKFSRDNMRRQLLEFFGSFPGLEHVAPDYRRATISRYMH